MGTRWGRGQNDVHPEHGMRTLNNLLCHGFLACRVTKDKPLGFGFPSSPQERAAPWRRALGLTEHCRRFRGGRGS